MLVLGDLIFSSLVLKRKSHSEAFSKAKAGEAKDKTRHFERSHGCDGQPLPYPGGTCTIRITPTATPNTTSTSTPAPTLFLVNGTNTNILSAGYEVLTYGNLYEDANIYSIDDTVNLPNGSIGGSGLYTNTNFPALSWSNSNDLIPGITYGETSTCDNNQKTNTDGQRNTAIINAYYSSAPQNYAAGYCKALTAGGYTDWYLPAICEIGYGTIVPSSTANCGTQSNPSAQNIWSNLYPLFPSYNGLDLWSSTQIDTDYLKKFATSLAQKK